MAILSPAYDETIHVLRRSLESAKVGETLKVDGLRRLDRFTRGIEECYAPRADFRNIVAHERTISESLGGRTARSGRKRGQPAPRQLMLF